MRIKHTLLAGVAGLLALGASASPFAGGRGEAADCTIRVSPAFYGYTLDKGSGGGRVPGHAYVGFRARPGAWLEGGGYQYWKQDGQYALYLVNNWPWGYVLHLDANG